MEGSSSDVAVGESLVSAATRARAAFDLRGVTSSLTVLRLRSRDLNLIERQLRNKVTQFPQFFHGAPVVLDVGGLEGGLRDFPLAALVRGLRVCRVVPIAVTNVAEHERELALSAGVGIITLGTREGEVSPEEAGRRAQRPQPSGEKTVKTPPPLPPAAEAKRPEPVAEAPRAPAAHRPPVVVRQSVRSGQVVYAEKTDLIVLAPVNPGAQLIADGNIHIYAPLRGRALAGAQGYAEARIFCQKIEAELIAIAGAYVTFDDIPRDRLGKPVQVFLQDGKCIIAPI